MSTRRNQSIKRLSIIPRPLLVIMLTSIILALLIVFDVFPFLRGDFGWRWPYLLAPLIRVLPLSIGLIFYILGAYVLLRRTTRPAFMLVWSMVGVVALSLLVVQVRADNVLAELFARTASILTTGVHYAGTHIAWNSPEWKDWIGVIQQNPIFGAHVVNGPPGLPLFYSVLSATLDGAPGISMPLYRALLPYQCQNYDLLSYTPGQRASAWFGVLMPVWATLGVLPLYAIASRLPGTKESARGIALWYPLIPALGMFAATWYTFYPVWMLVVFWLLVVGLDDHKLLMVALSGIVMGVSLFMAYAFVPVIGFFGVYMLVHYARRERLAGTSWYRPVLNGLWFGVGLALPWLIYWLWSGESPFALLAASLNLHLELDRPYLPWVFLHFWDWMLFNGFALMLAWLIGLWLWRRRGGQVPLIGLSLLIALIVLCISGTARGETGRVWLVFTPFALLAAGEILSNFGVGARHVLPLQLTPGSELWLVLAAALGVVMLALAASLNVTTTEFTPPPSPPQIADGLQPANALYTASNEGGAFRLIGWNGDAADGKITLKLAWEGAAQSTRPYYFGAVMVTPDGKSYNGGVWQPGQGVAIPSDSPDAPRGTYPTTCWSPGTRVGDSVELTLPEDAPPGDWWISLAAFGDATAPEGRLTVTLADGSQDTQIGLGPVTVH